MRVKEREVQLLGTERKRERGEKERERGESISHQSESERQATRKYQLIPKLGAFAFQLSFSGSEEILIESETF